MQVPKNEEQPGADTLNNEIGTTRLEFPLCNAHARGRVTINPVKGRKRKTAGNTHEHHSPADIRRGIKAWLEFMDRILPRWEHKLASRCKTGLELCMQIPQCSAGASTGSNSRGNGGEVDSSACSFSPCGSIYEGCAFTPLSCTSTTSSVEAIFVVLRAVCTLGLRV